MYVSDGMLTACAKIFQSKGKETWKSKGQPPPSYCVLIHTLIIQLPHSEVFFFLTTVLY